MWVMGLGHEEGVVQRKSMSNVHNQDHRGRRRDPDQ
jgi:hypothetical protein